MRVCVWGGNSQSVCTQRLRSCGACGAVSTHLCSHQVRREGGEVARPRADVEKGVASTQVERLEGEGVDAWRAQMLHAVPIRTVLVHEAQLLGEQLLAQLLWKVDEVTCEGRERRRSTTQRREPIG